LPFQKRTEGQIADISRGGYILVDCDGEPEVIIIATGSEIGIAVEAADQLGAEGKRVRVVSMPCSNLFDEQDQSYKDAVLPPAVTRRVAVEAGVSNNWYRYSGTQGAVLGLDRFGMSAPAPEVFKHFGFTVENLRKMVTEIL
jgi:transketolase